MGIIKILTLFRVKQWFASEIRKMHGRLMYLGKFSRCVTSTQGKQNMRIIKRKISTVLLAATIMVGGVSVPMITNAATNSVALTSSEMQLQQLQRPTDSEVVALADKSVRIFMESVSEKNMDVFWKHISLQFQKKYSSSDLDATFKDFYEVPITGDPLAGKSPIFVTRPIIDENNYLVLKGFYPTHPSRLSFHLTYVKEGFRWKVIGINASLNPIAPPAT